ncbi:hypothetical protein J5690_02610 [bacterium]|nr:hypothetical protein [bacterium]
MSKFFKLLAVLVLSLCFAVSCGDSKKSEEKQENQGDQAEEQEKNDSENQENGVTGESADNDPEQNNDSDNENMTEEFVTIANAPVENNCTEEMIAYECDSGPVDEIPNEPEAEPEPDPVDTGDNVYYVAKCGNNLCAVVNAKWVVYEGKTDKVLWESEGISFEKVLQNDNFVYLINRKTADALVDHEFDVKIIKTNDWKNPEYLGSFELQKEESSYLHEDRAAVSDNNVLAYSLAVVDENHKTRTKLVFYDMNDLSDAPKMKSFEFDYKKLVYNPDLMFAVGNTFWTSGCELEISWSDGDKYRCYAIPFDVSDPKNPKQGERVSIPGMLVGMSDDGKYLYTKTPPSYRRENAAPTCRKLTLHDIYTLKFNEDKAAVSIVKKEMVEDSDLDIDCNVEQVSNYVYIKGGKMFFVKHDLRYSRRESSERSRTSELRIVSATEEKEEFKDSFESEYFWLSVSDGGISFAGENNASYVSPEGKVTNVKTDDFSVLKESIINSQFFDGSVYFSAGKNGIYSFDVE